jgi:ATP-dependent DNA helicase RecQ
LYSKSDRATLHKRITESFPDKEFIRSTYERVCNFLGFAIGEGAEQMREFSLNQFCQTFHTQTVQTISALEILTQAGALEFIEETDALSRVMMEMRRDELYNLPDIDETTDRVLQCLLRSYTGLFADYVMIHEELLQNRLNLTQQEVYEALLKLSRLRVLHYIPRKRTPFIYLPVRRVEGKYIVIPHSVYEARKERMKERIEYMIAYATAESCRASILLHYFDEEPTADCNTCDVCRASRTRPLDEERLEAITRELMHLLNKHKTIAIAQATATIRYPHTQVVEVIRRLIDEGIISSNGVDISTCE